MGFFLTDAIQSAFTPRGTHANEGAQRKVENVRGGFIEGFDVTNPQTLALLKLLASAGTSGLAAQENTFQTAIQGLLQQLAGELRGGQGRAEGEKAYNRALQTGTRSEGVARASNPNMGPGMSRALTLNTTNNAARAQADALDPQAEAQRRAMVMQSLFAALQAGASLSPLGAATDRAVNRSTTLGGAAAGIALPQVQPNFLAQAAGQALGMWAGGGFGGGGGGGGAPQPVVPPGSLNWTKNLGKLAFP